MEDRGPHWLFSSTPLHLLVNVYVFVSAHVCVGVHGEWVDNGVQVLCGCYCVGVASFSVYVAEEHSLNVIPGWGWPSTCGPNECWTFRCSIPHRAWNPWRPEVNTGCLSRLLSHGVPWNLELINVTRLTGPHLRLSCHLSCGVTALFTTAGDPYTGTHIWVSSTLPRVHFSSTPLTHS